MTHLRTILAAALLLAAATLGTALSVAPATAADTSGACEGAHGVTVIVQPRSLGGQDEFSCDLHGGGRTAARIFADVGHRLTPVQSSPSFVCRIDGQPADASCAQTPPANAYWSLWWSNGTSPWTYSSLAADALTVPDGGSVAFTWVDGSDDGNPASDLGGAPSAPSSPQASGAASRGPSTAASPSGGGGGASTSATSTSVTSTGRAAGDRAASSADHDGGLPGWVPPLVLVVLVGGAAGVALARRRRT